MRIVVGRMEKEGPVAESVRYLVCAVRVLTTTTAQELLRTAQNAHSTDSVVLEINYWEVR